MRIRVECRGEARSISRLSVCEELTVGWPEALEALEPLEAARIHFVATRDVHLTPPAILHGPGCYMDVRIKLPQVPDNVRPEAPPLLRVVDVVCP